MERVISFVGLFVMIGLAWLMSSNKRKFPWRVVIGGLILQFLFAAVMFASRDSAAAAIGKGPEPVAAAKAEDVAATVEEEPADAVAEAGPAEETANAAKGDEAEGKAAPEVPKPRRGLLGRVDDAFNALIDCVDAGSEFVFGANFKDHFFAFRVLPSIIFFAALMQGLYYLGVMQQIVRGLGFVVQRTLGTTNPSPRTICCMTPR